MKRKEIALFLALFLAVGALCSCADNTLSVSSGVAGSDQMIIGSANENAGEYPYYNESVNFSDVSIPLTSEIPSELSSENNRNDKSSSVYSTITNVGSSKVTTNSEIINSNEAESSKESSKESSVTTSSKPAENSGTTVNYNNMKAVWISYLDLSSILTGKTEAQFRTNFKRVCQNSANFGINTLICHVRSFGDAIYPSQYFAWSQMAAGVGKNPGYDPLKIMIDIAHEYDLSFHAWINPFRTFTSAQISSVPSSTVFKKWYNDSSKNGKYIVQSGTRWYYNPGYFEVRELILNGVKEIINNYKVDGIHFDDYFYPTTDASFDSDAFTKYGSGKTLANFRRDCVSELVKSVYDAVNAKNKNILFGISPDANVDNDMNTQYADVKLWGSQNGYVDYLCPQIYYSYKSESKDFSSTLNTWNKLITASSVKLTVGLACDRVGWCSDKWACSNKSHTDSTTNCGKFGWQTATPSKSNILATQYNDAMSVSKCSGVFLYRYEYLFNMDLYKDSTTYVSNAAEQAKYEMQNLKAAMK